MAQLYVEGERLGWTFRDRNLFRFRFPDPFPVPDPVPPQLFAGAERARQKQGSRIVLAASLGFGAALLFGCCAGMLETSGSSNESVLGALAVLAAAGGIAGIIGVVVFTSRAQSNLQRAFDEQRSTHQAACAVWEQRRIEFDASEQHRVDQLAEWGAAYPPPGTRRVDIVGGSIWGWEALLTVFGGSLLRTRGTLTLVDFTGEAACRELLALAQAMEISTDVKVLPAQLAETNLLSGLAPRQLVDTLVESMYGDTPTGTRADRAQDDRILTAVCDALGDDVSLARIGAALRVLMGEPGTHSVLRPHERETIADNLFADEFKRQVHPNLRRIESYIHPLEELGARADTAASATLTCLVDASDGRNARRELLKDLTIQWLTRRVSAQALGTRTLVIVGADEVSHLHLERLTELCERRDIRLVLLFSHLRDSSVLAIGSGAVGFMRLANHEEARQAAEFIGRQHKFVLSQLTRTLGGNDTHSVADTQGGSTQRGGGWSGGFLLGERHSNWGVSRNWGQTITQATGTNWSDAAAAQRVYEYAVEPNTIQHLPDYALLLIKGQGNVSVLQPVECNPDIVLLPRVTMDPLPDLPLPDPARAAIPMAGSPTQLPVSAPPRLGAMGPAPGRAAEGVLPDWGTTGPISGPPYGGPYPPR